MSPTFGNNPMGGVFIFLSIVCFGCAGAPTNTNGSGGNRYPILQEFVFTSKNNDNWEVFRTRPNTGQTIQLTHTLLEEEAVSPSFDGKRLAFVSKRDGDYEIYVMHSDGSGQQRLTYSRGVDEKPVWIKGTSKILFESARDGNWEIYIMDVDGNHQMNLTRTAADEADPVLSPDGSRVLFKSLRDGVWKLYMMELAGLHAVPLAESSYQEGVLDDPSWSPDGTEIAFISHRDGNSEIYKLRVPEVTEGRIPNSGFPAAQRLTVHPATDESPVWSPDGKSILFISNRNGTRAIHKIGAGGEYQGLLGYKPLDEGAPRWSSDSQWIAYLAESPSGPGIQVINATDRRRFWIDIMADETADLEWIPGVEANPGVRSGGENGSPSS